MIIQAYTHKAKERILAKQNLPTVNDECVMKYFYSSGGKRLNKQKLIDIPEHIYNYLNTRYSDSTCIEETLQRIKLGIDIHPVCPVCGKPCKYVGGTRFFLQTCGNKECSKITNQQHLKETCLEKYGVSNGAKTKQAKERQAETNIKRYGTKSPLQNDEVHNKTIETNIQKYGVTIAQYNDSIKEKIANSNKETCLEKYGFENIMFVDGIREKMQQTMIDKYGVINYVYSDEYNEKCNEIHNKIRNTRLSDIVKHKKYNTHKHNNSFNISAIEHKIETYFTENNIQYISQYYSDNYPFNCDFYLPQYNLYIEIQGSWTHGGHPYDKDNDINILCKWLEKSKTSDYYKNAIKTWTIRDVGKREIAKQNKLNYLEIFSADLNECINQINKRIAVGI